MRKLLLLAALAALATPADAAEIRLGRPGYGGSGCPGGSASVVLSADRQTLSILFDRYEVSAGGTTGRSFDRKNCSLAIPVQVPQGISVSILSVDYRGYNNLPRGATSDFNVEYFFAGGTGPKFQRTFRGPLEDDYIISNKIAASAVVWSGCGADVNLRTNSSIRVRAAGGSRALATVDSQDIRAAIIYHLRTRPC